MLLCKSALALAFFPANALFFGVVYEGHAQRVKLAFLRMNFREFVQISCCNRWLIIGLGFFLAAKVNDLHCIKDSSFLQRSIF